MKKLKCFFGVVLALLMVLTFAACGPNDGNGQVGLIEAAEKLKTANSFRLVMTMDAKVSMEQDGEQKEEQHIDTLTYLMSRKPEGTTITAEEQRTYITAGQTNEMAGDQYYFSGNEAYVWDSNSTSPVVDKWVSDRAYDLAFVMDEVGNTPIGATDFAVLKKIEQLSPTKKTDADGTVTHELRDMNAKDFASVYALLADDIDAEEIEQALNGDCKLHIAVKINKDGYMTQFRLDMCNVTLGSNRQDMVIFFTFDQINQIPDIAQPDLVKTFALVDGMGYTQITDGKKARYYYWSDGADSSYFRFEGFAGRYDDEYTVASYEVPSELEGKPVAEINYIVWNGEITVERLIIPEGVKLDMYDSYKETTLFFKDKQEDVEKNFYIAGEENTGAQCVVKAAYYQGQWEMVNGIPTPKD